MSDPIDDGAGLLGLAASLPPLAWLLVACVVAFFLMAAAEICWGGSDRWNDWGDGAP